jgi:hypothetical protein
LDALSSITDQSSFEILLFDIIINLEDFDLDLFVKLFLNIELFSQSNKIVLESIHIDAYAAYEKNNNFDDIYEMFSN